MFHVVMLMVIVAQSLSIALPSRRCSAAVSVVVLRGSTGIAPAGKCCLISNGLVNIDSPIMGPFWVFIVLVNINLGCFRKQMAMIYGLHGCQAQGQAPFPVCVCMCAHIRFGEYGRILDNTDNFSKNVNLPHFLV
jgi:hypothetical protein